MNLTELVIKKIEELGDKAPEYFNKSANAVKMMAKTKNITLAIAQKVLDDLPQAETPPVQTAPDVLQKHDQLLVQIVNYLNASVIPLIETDWKALLARVQTLEKRCDELVEALLNPPARNNGGTTVGQLLGSSEIGSRIRPAAQTIATYSEPVGGGLAQMVGHPLDTGIAPTKDQVDASLNVAQGAQPGQPSKLAGPAVAVPGSENFGRKGWTDPYPVRR